MIMIKNNAVTFNVELARGNGVKEFLGEGVFFTRFGWFYPVTFYATNILSWLEGKLKRGEKNSIEKGILIEPDGTIYEITQGETGTFHKRRCMLDEHSIYFRSELKKDQTIATIIELDPLMSGADIFDNANRACEGVTCRHVTRNISELLSEWAIRFPPVKEDIK